MSKTKVRPGARKSPQSTVISPVLIGIVTAAAILLVGGLVYLGNQTRTGQAVDESQFPTLGDPNAPVTLTEFSDYG